MSLDACGKRSLSQYNSGFSEIVYAQLLQKHARRSCAGFEPHVIIDTSRNGPRVPRDAASCAGWCNLRTASLGHVPSIDTSLPDLVDAYVYVKTPGESDGCSRTLPNGKACARYDEGCGSAASLGSLAGESPAPEAGVFFPQLMLSLATNASLGRLPSARVSAQDAHAHRQWTSATMAFALGLAVGAALAVSALRVRGMRLHTWRRRDGSPMPMGGSVASLDATMPFERQTSTARLLAPPAVLRVESDLSPHRTADVVAYEGALRLTPAATS